MRKKLCIYSGFIFLIDLITKYLVIGKRFTIIPNFLYIDYVKNTGVAFSMFEGSRYIIILISVLAIIYLFKTLKEKELILYSLILGGILGNLFDRIFNGYVIDFISVKIFGYYFPVFNIADICITVGCIILIIYLAFGGKDETNSK